MLLHNTTITLLLYMHFWTVTHLKKITSITLYSQQWSLVTAKHQANFPYQISECWWTPGGISNVNVDLGPFSTELSFNVADHQWENIDLHSTLNMVHFTEWTCIVISTIWLKSCAEVIIDNGHSWKVCRWIQCLRCPKIQLETVVQEFENKTAGTN